MLRVVTLRAIADRDVGRARPVRTSRAVSDLMVLRWCGLADAQAVLALRYELAAPRHTFTGTRAATISSGEIGRFRV